MICLKTFKHKYPSDFNNWDDWVQFVNQNKTNDLKSWKGKCKATDLPSHHPYWKLIVKLQKRNTLHNLISNYNNCKKDESRIKYIFNQNTTLEDLQKRIEILKAEIYS